MDFEQDLARLQLVSGAGNRFALLDAREGVEAPDPAGLARELCGGGVLRGGAADGLLVLSEPREGGDLRLVVWNADGSRAAACGNGLRCAAWFVLRRAPITRKALRVETDCGLRGAELVEARGASARIRAGMGRAQRMARIAAVRWNGRELEATGVLLGNPHCVLRVSDERSAPVEALGRALQSHPDFPDGVNVGFLARRDDRWRLRVFERGVGETAACGSGACAAAVASGDAELERGGVEIEMQGGLLRVERDPSGELWLTGAAEELGPYPGRVRA